MIIVIVSLNTYIIMANLEKKRYIIARHGQSIGNLKYDLGQPVKEVGLGTKLTDLGMQQSLELGKYAEEIGVKIVYSSPYLRARQTAEVANKILTVPLCLSIALKERQSDGVVYQRKKGADMNSAWEYAGEDLDVKTYYERESKREALQRLLNYLNYLDTLKENTVLLITHSVIIRSLLVYIGYGNFDELLPGSVENGASVTIQKHKNNILLDDIRNIKKME